MGRETRSYETEEQAYQAYEDLNDNGALASFSSSGGDSDGIGGEYEVSFPTESYEETKGMRD